MSSHYQTDEQKRAESERSFFENYILWLKWMFKFVINSK